MNPRHLPPVWQAFARDSAPILDSRNAWRFAWLLLGALLTQRRHTVTAWLQSAGRRDFRPFYDLIESLGRRRHRLADALLEPVVATAFAPDAPVTFAIDDTPGERSGLHVEGVGRHHNPTPGPAGHSRVHGHVFVTLAAVPRHPTDGVVGLPITAELYVRRADIDSITSVKDWPFCTKLTMASQMIERVAASPALSGRVIQVAVDGAYVCREVLDTARATGVTVVGRIRKDAALRTLPGGPTGRRGRPRVYGEQAINLGEQATRPDGWQLVEVFQYGQMRTKSVKVIDATWAVTRGRVRVVIVKTPETADGWRAYGTSDGEMSAATVLEVAAARTGIEGTFRDVKQESGACEQQVRRILRSIGSFQVAMWTQTLTRLETWNSKGVPARGPWDRTERRASVGERRRELRAGVLRGEFEACVESASLPAKIRGFVERLIDRAA
jgi:hypothetical protein